MNLNCIYFGNQSLFDFSQAPPKQVPKTIENTRVKDETIVDVNDEEVEYELFFTK